MNKRYKATVVVLNYNGEKIVGSCLSSIINQNLKNLEIIVVDNDSKDNSVKIVKSFPSVKLIKNRKNLGFTGGNWIGISKANSEFVAFINNDTILDRNWMKCMLDLIESDPMIGAVAGKVLKPNGNIDSIGGLISYPSGRAKFDRGYESGKVEDLVALPGSAFMVRKKVALKVGFLDRDYFVLYEETDFFWRLRLAGYRCIYSPKALSWHMHSYTFTQASSWTTFRRMFFYLRNMMQSNLKNLEKRYLVPYILFEAAFSIKQAVKLFVSQKDEKLKDYVKAYYIAIVINLLSLRRLILKRRSVQAMRKVPDSDLIKKFHRDEDIVSRGILRLMRMN